MFVYNLAKTQKERLTDYQQDLLRKWKVNDLNSISFSVFRNDVNKAAFDLLDNEIFIEYDNVNYVIRNIDKVEIGETVAATITAEHEFFWRTMNEPGSYVYGTLSDMDRSINGYMDYIFRDMSYTFTIFDSFDSQKIESFGGDYVLALFNKILDAFQCEFEVFDKEVRIYNRIGTQTAYPYRSKHNISDVTKKGTSSNFCTYIKGQGKKIEDKNILKGESKNLESLTGTWADKTDPYWYTDQVGATFKMMWYGTGIRFWYLQDPSGGQWEFKLEGEQTATLSTWGKTTELKSIQLFMDANEQAHTIVATFKGDDSKNTPSTGKGKSRGWVRASNNEDLKTFEVYRLRKDDEQYAVVAEYISPLAKQFGIRPQAPIQDEDATTESQLMKSLKNVLNDRIEISYTTNLHDLSKMGGPMPKQRYGNSVPFIVEKLDLLIEDVRIMEMDEYPELDKSPTIVLGNSRQTYGQAAFNATKAQLDKVYDSRKGKIRENVYSDRIKITTQALINSLTQLEYPEGMGILARDPNDYNKFTVFRSSGLGITQNGGLTFDEAITPLGINTSLLTAGQIKTNNIQIIGKDNLFYWDGTELIAIDPDNAEKFARMRAGEFYIKGGGFVVERPDGYKVIDDGIIQYGYAIQGMTPQFCSPEVTIAPRSCYTTETTAKDFQAYEFRHDARYLRVRTSQYQSGGGTCYMSVEQSYEGFEGWRRWALLSSTVSEANASSDDTERETLIDFGVPTGTRKRIYIRIWSSNKNVTAYGRVTGIWQEG